VEKNFHEMFHRDFTDLHNYMKAFATGGASNDNEAGFFVDVVMHKFVVQSRGAVTFA
jgi:hypothetical protein